VVAVQRLIKNLVRDAGCDPGVDVPALPAMVDQVPEDAGQDLLVGDRLRAGAALPVEFSLGGDQGLGILAAGSPRSWAIDCHSGVPRDDVEETVTVAECSLSYDPVNDRYTYVWKTKRSWAGTCRRLEVALNDGSSHLTDVRFR
jgi:hypothetical protein